MSGDGLMPQPPPVPPASVTKRRTAAGLLLVAVLVGALLIVVVRRIGPTWAEWLVAAATAGGLRAGAVAAGLAVAFAAPLLVVGAYTVRLGGRVARDDRFPPARMSVVRDIEVVTGPPAQRRARRFRRLGWGLIGFGVAAGSGFWWILQRLLDSIAP